MEEAEEVIRDYIEDNMKIPPDAFEHGGWDTHEVIEIIEQAIKAERERILERLPFQTFNDEEGLPAIWIDKLKKIINEV